MKVKVSINSMYKGKPDVKTGVDFWRKFNGGFRNKHITITELMNEIRLGHTFSTMVKGYRKEANFICGQLIALDFDTGDYNSSFNGLMENEYIREYSHFFYTTHSHTEQKPKSRVVFVLPRAIYEKSIYAELAEMTVRFFGINDTKCNDPCRIFFGAVDCEFKFLGNILPIEVAQELFVEPMKLRIEEQRKKAIEAMALANSSGYSANGYDTRAALDNLLNKMRSAPLGQTHHTLCQVSYALGGYIASGMDEQESIMQMAEVLKFHPNVVDTSGVYRTMLQCVEKGKASPLEIPIAEPFAKYLGIDIGH